MANTKVTPVSISVQPKSGSAKDLEFTQESIIVGTGATAHLKLDDGDVSPTHCILKFKADGSLVVMDLGSDNGTSVNGKDIDGETKLTDGIQLKVGSTRLTVHFGGHVAENATVPIRPGKSNEQAASARSAVEEATDPVSSKKQPQDDEATERAHAPPPPKKKDEAKAAKAAKASDCLLYTSDAADE